MAQISERVMERPEELVSFIQDDILFCSVLLITSFFVTLLIVITSSTSLFAELIAVEGTLRDSGPLGDGKAICGDEEDALE